MKIMEKIKKTCDLLWAQSRKRVLTLEPEMVLCDYKTDNSFPTEGWGPMWDVAKADQHFWHRVTFSVPEVPDNAYPVLHVDFGASGWDAQMPQGLVYLNGKMTAGIDVNHSEVYLEPNTAYEMYNYLYTASIASPVHVTTALDLVYTDVDGLYYDLWVMYLAIERMNENTQAYVQIRSCMEQAAAMVDFRLIGSPRYFESIREARKFLKDEFYDKLCSTEGKPVVNCIGHTHIDVEWLWTRAQTKEKMQRSASTVLMLMEKYPEYQFMLSQPELYRYLKEEAPEKYEELKQRVKEGRWEPEGAMYLEADCNLVSGESFVRQLMQGTRFFRDEFGKECHVLFLPDVFGYSAALPQILKKSGIDYFVTSKISWNDTNTMPYDAFMWQGIDGTEIFSSFITAQWSNKDHRIDRRTTYVGYLDSGVVMGAWDRFQQKDYADTTLLTFGFGDGGGGPTRDMLEKYRRLSKGLPDVPVAKIGFVKPYLDESKRQFDLNCKKLKRTPKWIGELYLEYHRGTYTSQAANKRGNRKAELGLQKTETLSVISLLNGGSYDASGLYAVWRRALHNQFHDILPGSSINEVYQGTKEDYREISAYYNGVIGDKMAGIAASVASAGGTLIYNPLGFEKKGIVTVNGETRETAEAIPAFGWKVVSAFAAPDVRITGSVAENKAYRLTVDNTGRIAVYDKDADRDVFAGFGNEFQAYEDYPSVHDAWEIEDNYKSKHYLLDEPADITPVFDGSRAGFRVIKHYLNSVIEQKIWLYSDSRRIDFETDIDWHEKQEILKVAFPVDVHATKTRYEIQFGHVERTNSQNHSWEQAKFEVCGHKWVDMADNGYGMALLNDCKYGFNTEENVLKLTVLKCAENPDPHADEGHHTFTYAILPHTGSLYEAGVIREAYALNQPMNALNVKAQAGALPEAYSLLSCDSPAVVIETVKKAEDSDGIIVRMYEAFDSRVSAVLSVDKRFTKATLCDLMERELEPLDLTDGQLKLKLHNFEIVTIKLEK